MRTIVTLKGKTLKGKNRIREQGEIFILLKEEEFLKDERGPWIFIEQPNGPHARWVKKTDDKNFEIISIKEEEF